MVVIAVGASAIAGIREGNIILSVNQTQIRTVEQFWVLMDAESWRAALVIRRGETQIIINVGELDLNGNGAAGGSSLP